MVQAELCARCDAIILCSSGLPARVRTILLVEGYHKGLVADEGFARGDGIASAGGFVLPGGEALAHGKELDAPIAVLETTGLQQFVLFCFEAAH